MSKEELIQFLKDNLKIFINIKNDVYVDKKINAYISVFLDEEKICDDYVDFYTQ